MKSLNNNRGLIELSYIKDKVSVVKEWIQESKKQKAIDYNYCAWVVPASLQIFPLVLWCFLWIIVLVTSVEKMSSCETSAPRFFNQALKPLVLLLTNGSFRRRVKLFFPRFSSSSTSNRLMWRNILNITTSIAICMERICLDFLCVSHFFVHQQFLWSFCQKFIENHVLEFLE